MADNKQKLTIDNSVLTVKASAPGKINLLINVGAPQEDGYHPLETVFLATDLRENVYAQLWSSTALASSNLTLEYVDIGNNSPDTTKLATDETNLAVRAARALQKATGSGQGARLRIEKYVPIAGGMAGGSADAAATLVALNELWQLHLPISQLLEIGATLGADVPFCLLGWCAHGTNRGDKIQAIFAPQQYWVVALLPVEISTPRVFKAFDMHNIAQLMPVSEGFYQALEAGDWSTIGNLLNNDLAAAAIELEPMIAKVLTVFAQAGALGQIVSGSGPTCVALASDKTHAELLARTVAETLADLRVKVMVISGPTAGAQIEQSGLELPWPTF